MVGEEPGRSTPPRRPTPPVAAAPRLFVQEGDFLCSGDYMCKFGRMGQRLAAKRTNFQIAPQTVSGIDWERQLFPLTEVQ
jgi:hypothetical protein